ncbi:MAG: hypothetical protein KJO88_05395 [Gammaproteobacteria bacterium]|nr:hypothetical protein [Gammaproteobacteria bacterium]
MKNLKLIVVTAGLILSASNLYAEEHKGPSKQDMMTNMHSHMQLMQKHMKKINETKDPKVRKKLMQEHMQSMQKGMKMMGEMDKSNMSSMMKDKMKSTQESSIEHKAKGLHDHKKKCEKDDQQCERMQNMESKQDSTHQKMQMMQKMMEQMMEHQKASEESQK